VRDDARTRLRVIPKLFWFRTASGRLEKKITRCDTSSCRKDRKLFAILEDPELCALPLMAGVITVTD
jgi:hypothetical protein